MSTFPRVGELKHRINIEVQSFEPDGQGGQVVTWTPVAEVWAKIEPVSSYERLFSRQIQYQRSHKVTMRYLSDLTAGVTSSYRFWFDGRLFQIKGIYKEGEKNFWLKLDAEENQGT